MSLYILFEISNLYYKGEGAFCWYGHYDQKE